MILCIRARDPPVRPSSIPVEPRGTYMHLWERLIVLLTVFLRHQSNCKRLTYLSETQAGQSILHVVCTRTDGIQLILILIVNFVPCITETGILIWLS